MIEPKEINKVAAANRVNDRQIEKDYALSWVLFAISKNKILNKALVFKGGTVLKKAYFEDYRFSEDLDFTLIDETIRNEQILAEFDKLFDFIKEEANIDMQIDEKNGQYTNQAVCSSILITLPRYREVWAAVI